MTRTMFKTMDASVQIPSFGYMVRACPFVAYGRLTDGDTPYCSLVCLLRHALR